MQPENLQTLLEFFKALAHESRLKIVGLLAEQERSVGELAHLLDLKDPTVSHHLNKLEELGLVEMRQDGTSHYYRLNTKRLESLNKELLTPGTLATFNAENGDSWEAKVLRTFVDGDRIKTFPTSFKKQVVILRWLIEKFEFDRRYPEKELNELIKKSHEDYASLRREFVDYKFMQRENGIYWRLPREESDRQIENLLNSKMN